MKSNNVSKKRFNNRTHFFRYLGFEGALATIQTSSVRLTSVFPGNLNDPNDLNFLKKVPFTSHELQLAVAYEIAFSLLDGRIPSIMQKSGRLGPSVKPPKIRKGTTLEEMVNESMSDIKFNIEHKGHYDKLTSKTNQEFIDFFEDHFLLCLTTSAQNSRMWERYADDYQGAVIRFECLRGNSFLAAQKVNYSDTPPTFGTREEWLSLIQGGTGIDHRRLYQKYITWKGREWEYEDEWRIILPSEKDKGKVYTYYNVAHDEISEIYLGKNMIKSNKEMICSTAIRLFPKVKIVGL